MTNEFEFYHGLVFTKLIHNSREAVSIRLYSRDSNSSYILNDNIGLYIKYSTKRLSPWHFSFQKINQDEIHQLKDQLGHVFLILVCGEDGIVSLSFEELKKINNGKNRRTNFEFNLRGKLQKIKSALVRRSESESTEIYAEVDWISVTRTFKKEYTVKGSAGGLDHKIGKSDFPKKIFEPYKDKELILPE